jgi:salicylate hydroxylase
MHVYERIRKRRCELVSVATRRNGESIHLADGEEQEERDRAMSGKQLKSDWPLDIGPVADANFRNWLMGHDVLEYVSVHPSFAIVTDQ